MVGQELLHLGQHELLVGASGRGGLDGRGHGNSLRRPRCAGVTGRCQVPWQPVRTWTRLLLIALLAGVGLAAIVIAVALPVEALVNHGANSMDNAIADINAPRSERSTVYAADGSVLAILHAQENRVPVTHRPGAARRHQRRRSTPRTPGSGPTAPSTSSRRCGRWRPTSSRAWCEKAARPSPSSWSRTIFLTPQRQLDRKIKEAVIATRLQTEVHQEPDPRGVPERGVLRQRRLRGPGRGPDLLQRGHQPGDPGPGGAAGRHDPGSLAATTRSPTPRTPRPGATSSSTGWPTTAT